MKPFEVINPNSSTKRKKGRQSNPRGNFTCSKHCARIYNALYNHFQKRLKKQVKENKK